MNNEKVFHPLLDEFKKRMRIFHDAEDDNLSMMLVSSESAIERLVGSKDIENPQIKELILERSRYVYNDQEEFFYDNFQKDLQGLSLEFYNPEEEKNEDKSPKGVL